MLFPRKMKVAILFKNISPYHYKNDPRQLFILDQLQFQRHPAFQSKEGFPHFGLKTAMSHLFSPK